jgi:hypothetical protein
MARARPSWAIWATFVACGLVRLALVATTPNVVFPPHRGRAPSNSATVSPSVPSSMRGPARIPPLSGSLTLPNAFTTARAATTSPPSSRTEALPSPPFIDRSGPRMLPTVAPVPAPTLPWAKSPLVADEAAS